MMSTSRQKPVNYSNALHSLLISTSHSPAHKIDNIRVQYLMISSNVNFLLKLNVMIRMPKVPMTSKKEDIEMARVRIMPD